MTETKNKTVNERMILASIVLGSFMAALDATIVTVALPTMAEDFATRGSTTGISWVLLGYTLALCCFILLWGKLGSRYGYRKLFVTGVGIFALMSLFIGLIGTFGGAGLTEIVILRIVQGLGAGMIMSMSLAMVGCYMPNSKGKATGAITLASSAGTAFGPALGGLLCNFDWSFIFFINVPIGILCLLMCAKYMSAVSETLNRDQKLDTVGTVFMVLMMFTLVYFLNTGNGNGWTSETSIGLMFLIMIFAGLLVWWEQRVADPLISLRLMGQRDVVEGNAVALLLFAGMAGTYFLLPYFLELCQGYSTVEMGLIIIANSVGMMVVGPAVGRHSDRTGLNSRVVSLGCLIMAAGLLMMVHLAADTSLWYILLALFIMGAGTSIALVADTNLCLGYAEKDESGEVSGLINTFRQAGSTAGVAITEAVFAASVTFTALGFSPSALMTGFRPAFVVTTLLVLIAFVLSMHVKDKKVRMITDGF